MSRCDTCNLDYYTCANCPHQEPELTFAENLEIGWDYAIEELCRTTTDCVMLELIEIYWKGYTYQENADPDAGKCFEIRQYAIKEILKRLEEIK